MSKSSKLLEINLVNIFAFFGDCSKSELMVLAGYAIFYVKVSEQMFWNVLKGRILNLTMHSK